MHGAPRETNAKFRNPPLTKAIRHPTMEYIKIVQRNAETKAIPRLKCR